MSDVKRYEAVHLRYDDNNIRYGEGCEVEVVLASDYAALATATVQGVNAQLLEAADNAVDVFSDECRRRLEEIQAVQQLSSAIAAARQEGGKV